jgi:uncharacterized membrane protein
MTGKTPMLMMDQNLNTNEKMEPDFWQAPVRQVAESLKANKASVGLIRVIAQCGEEPRKHFPRKAGDTDELSNLLMRE